jgi:hypothetical protein
MKHRKFQPRLEALENRWAPALLIQLDGSGNLTGIFGVPDGVVDLVFTADDEVNVVEDGNDLGTYAVSGNVNVFLGNNILTDADSVVNVDFATNAATMSGSLRIQAGNAINGYDVNVTGDGALGTVEIAGNLTVVTGNGAENINVTDMEVGGNTSIDVNVEFSPAPVGCSVVFDNSTVEGNTYVADAIDVQSIGSTFEGNFTYVQSFGQDSIVAMDAASTIEGSGSFTYGAGDDCLELAATVLGNVFARMGSGQNDWNLTLGAPANILGSLTYVGGSGIDDLFLDGFVGGNVTFTGKGGVDAVEFGSEVALTVLGSNITLVMGNGDDTFTNVDLTAPGARLTFLGGNGDDTVDWSASIPAVASAYLDGGFGTNTCDLTGGVIAFPFTKRNFA